MRVLRLTGAKLLRLVATFVIVTFATTAMLTLVPGSPALFMAGDSATTADIRAINHRYHFDESVFAQYWHWLTNFVVHGDLGTSYTTKQPVWSAITDRLPVTVELAVLALIFTVAVAVPLAAACARRPNSWLDRIVGTLSSAAVSVPPFVVATVLLYLFAFQLKLLPSLGWTPLTRSPLQNLRTCILPVIAISLGEIVGMLRVLRSDLIGTLQQDFILLARAKGLSSRSILWRHALRPSSFSLLTLSGLYLGRFLGGTVIVETIFGLPGLGSLAIQAITGKNLVVVQGVVVFIAMSFLVLNLVVDLLYAVLDPRIRVSA